MPLLSLTVLWGYAATTTMNAALKKFNFSDNYDMLGIPANTLMFTLAMERSAAAVVVTGNGAAAAAAQEGLAQARGATDKTLASFMATLQNPDALDGLNPKARAQLPDTRKALEGLDTVRGKAVPGRSTPVEIINEYSRLIEVLFRMCASFTSVNDLDVARETAALIYMGWSRDLMLRQSALLNTLPKNAKIDSARRTAFADWAGSRERFFELSLHEVSGNIADILHGFAESPEFRRYVELEQSFLTAKTVPNLQEWRALNEQLAGVWMERVMASSDILKVERVEPVGQRIIVEFTLVAGLGLVAVIASLVLLTRFARNVSVELKGLRGAAQNLAQERLPRVVARLRRGEEVDPVVEAPPIETGKTREINEVAEAFGTVQHTAVDVAVAEAHLRKSIGQVFVNLSWRSQALLQRQLQLLDVMERRASSPEELEDLFKLDHLTTRMRRHAEGLVILSGAPTVRAWDHPVEMEDVVRAALGEVEDYTRVEVAASTGVAIEGEVVADVIHLLAELIENATMFSPPTTEVLVRAEAVANGVVVEIVDRGIGIYPEQLALLNRNLSQPPEFDLADSDRLGLFVVARLAAHHGIKVTLQPSVYGGTTAVVLMPETLIVRPGGESRGKRGQRAVQAGSGAPSEPRAVTAGAHRGPAAPPSSSSTGATTMVSDLPATSSSGRYTPPPSSTPLPPSVPPMVSEQSSPFSGYDLPPSVPETPQELFPQGQQQGQQQEQERRGGEGRGRLPRRNRQQHLAPQLRKQSQPGAGGSYDNNDEDGFVEPDPEFSRDLMSSLQSGWLQGRSPEDETTEFDTYDERERP
ncbi:sensor histidine kinase [Actinocorallia populi]|uniref:sensor histidine kinase n=1 Tax=Actinocorallia populi TaxID=2079200 RepID=UPI0013002BE6|nr:nitrate- and nitrite sensing domain-containing protein [Actinocorallia populi]